MSTVLRAPKHRAGPAILGWLLGLLGACSNLPLRPDGPAIDRASEVAPNAAGTLLRSHARWVPVRFAELPGWDSDRTTELWPALLRGCERPALGWANVC